ncbi:hypothetical protein KKG83_01790 [Candidatus Micrarchaeota archaeon]|nr:hypothetical protein [Candidatus Micrarchaeota archaeon]MBU2476181.1 hypothetical protein [Candidatus Micrarchaeota archaeon]
MKGIIHFEAMIALLVFFSLTGIFVSSLEEMQAKLEGKKDLVSAKESVISCSRIADSVYSNSASFAEIKENCFFEEGKIKSKKNKQTAEEQTITEKITNSEKGIEIGVEEHYK